MRLSTTRSAEETLADHLTGEERAALGAFFTPRALVDRTLDAVAAQVPSGPITIVDPACGAGAFLLAAAERFPHARLVGFEVDERSAALCRARVARAEVFVADALRDDVDAKLGQSGFELWVGNPPYNGTSALLRDAAAYERVRSWLPAALARGQSLRDDYAFFLLLAARRLTGRPGALAFITSASLLDAFAYAPLREHLLRTMRLHQVIELGAGAFVDARVSTCVTVWSTPGATDVVEGLTPEAPEFRLKPVDVAAQALHDVWSSDGEMLTTLVPVSSPGLKTRFDELLVDDERERLIERVSAFLSCTSLTDFSRQWAMPAGSMQKLEAIKRESVGLAIDERSVHRFIRYRGPLPRRPNGWCYVERRLIPRGDHRLVGGWNPHRGSLKLAFNVRELPLAAHLIDEPGCITAYRHSRFAPAIVPQAAIDGTLRRDVPLGAMVPNLSARAREYGEPADVFARIAAFVMSTEVQDVWAPAFGTTRVLPIPFSALEK